MEGVNPLRLISKALILFVVINLAFAALNPAVGRLSIYNWLVAGRQRLPYGSKPSGYNLSPDDLDAAFASHVISGSPKDPREYRVFLLGDSATWGAVLAPSQSLSERLDRANISACGKQLRFYNLAYPDPAALKDFIILNKALEYEPDLVVWMLTSTSLAVRGPARIWGSAANEDVSSTLHEYGLDRYRQFIGRRPTFLEETLVGQRKRFAKLILLQAYGILWNATGIDKAPSAADEPLGTDVPTSKATTLPGDVPLKSDAPSGLKSADLAFDVLVAAHEMIGAVPMLIVNEPHRILSGGNPDSQNTISNGPQAYDRYRRLLQGFVDQRGWPYLDLYDAIPFSEFTNSLHLNASAEGKLARMLAPQILKIACP